MGILTHEGGRKEGHWVILAFLSLKQARRQPTTCIFAYFSIDSRSLSDAIQMQSGCNEDALKGHHAFLHIFRTRMEPFNRFLHDDPNYGFRIIEFLRF